jgi:malate synthase
VLLAKLAEESASPEIGEIEVRGPIEPGFETILTTDAMHFIASLVSLFQQRRQLLLEKRLKISERIGKGVLPDFLPETEDIRKSSWKVGPVPSDLVLRRVEITGPVDRKMMINALNSGADVYMADFEDSHSPTWRGTILGQVNIRDAVEKIINHTSPDGKIYNLKDKTSTLCVRPRGLHLTEKHVLLDGEPVPASLFDFGLYLYHNHARLRENGTGPYYYLPKLENHLEAALWNDIFDTSEQMLGLPRNSIKCTVLIENVLAAFEMDEILHELRGHITALNFGRWDYIFSFIKKLARNPDFLLPDRAQLVMTTHFLTSCAIWLVQTCHKRGAYAIGGMAANVPTRNNPEAQKAAMERVIADKTREVTQGFDGAWVAHPDLVPIVMNVFNEHKPKRNPLQVTHKGTRITQRDLLFPPKGEITETGIRANVSVSLRYLDSWLSGNGCVAINNLMEDTATVEICRAQIWQWIRHEAPMSDGKRITPELFRTILKDEIEKAMIESGGGSGKLDSAAALLDHLATEKQFPDFMTLVAYDLLD